MCYDASVNATDLTARYAAISGLILIPVTLLFAFAFSPKQIEVYENMLCLKGRLFFKRILFADIDNVSSFQSVRNMRLFASGGLFGYFGYFTSSNYGKYYSFIGDYRQAFTISLKNGKVFAVSSADNESLMKYLKQINSK